MTRLPPIAAFVAAAALAVAPTASAQFGTPRALASDSQGVYTPVLLPGASSAAVWSSQSGLRDFRLSILLAPLSPAPGETPLRRFAPELEDATTYGRSSIALIRASPGNGEPSRIELVRTGGGRTAVETLDRSARFSRSRIAGNRAGDLVAAWIDWSGGRAGGVWAVSRTNGKLGSPRRLSSDRPRALDVAIDARGDAIVAWQAHGVVRAATRTTHHGFHAPVRIAASDTAFQISAAIAGHGQAAVAWHGQAVSEGDYGPARVQIVQRESNAHGWHTPTLLEYYAHEEPPQQDAKALVVLDGHGTGAVAWAGHAGVHARTISGWYLRRPLQDIAAPGAQIAALAADPASGGLLVAWRDGQNGTERLRAALAPRDGRFGPATTVDQAASQDGSGIGAAIQSATAAFDRDGRALLLYVKAHSAAGELGVAPYIATNP